MPNIKERDHAIDMARGIAMLLVIVGHIKCASSTVVIWIYSFHMPLFFALSGMVFSIKKYPGFSKFLRAKAKSLLVPYYCLNLILFVLSNLSDIFISLVKRETPVLDVKILKNFVGIFLGYRLTDYYFEMYFIMALFIALTAFYFVAKVAEKIKGRGFKNVFLIAFCVLSACIGKLILSENKGFFLSLDIVPTAMSFVSLGYLIGLNKRKGETERSFKIYLFPVALGINYVFMHLNGIADLNRADTGKLLYYMLAAVSGIWGVLILCYENRGSRLLEYIGRNSLIFYAFQHKFAIKNLTFAVTCVMGKTGVLLDDHRQPTVFFITVLSCLVLAAMSEIINRYFPFLIGKKKPENESAKD
ncbi:MAG: acyltransferase family protein [Clostridiales bacterium]|nr:acyltransferase family protein [Clostridiales bacterium]